MSDLEETAKTYGWKAKANDQNNYICANVCRGTIIFFEGQTNKQTPRVNFTKQRHA